MQEIQKDIIPILVAGFSCVLILILFFILLIVLFQRRIRKKQTELYTAIIETQEREQQRIGKDLHDQTGASLSALKILVDLSKRSINIDADHPDHLTRALGLIDDIASNIRTASHNLMPAVLNEYGLVLAIEDLVENLNHSKKLKIDYVHDNFSIELSDFLKTGLYRIIQELLNNVIKHANATTAFIEIRSVKTRVYLIVKDNGIGLTDNSNRNGIGLKNIQNRVQMLNGSFGLEGNTGNGTIIKISIDTKE